MITRGVVTRRPDAAASTTSRAVMTAPRTSATVAARTSAVSGIDRRAVCRSGIQVSSAGKGSESISRRKIRSMLSSGSISHLRAHSRFGLREGRAYRPRLHAEVPGDLPVIEAEVELRDDHGPLTLAQPGEEPADFHPVKERFDLVVAALDAEQVERQ